MYYSLGQKGRNKKKGKHKTKQKPAHDSIRTFYITYSWSITTASDKYLEKVKKFFLESMHCAEACLK